MAQLLTVTEVATVLRMSEQKVYTLCRDGSLKAAQIGSQWRIDEDDLKDFIRASQTAPDAPGEASTDSEPNESQ